MREKDNLLLCYKHEQPDHLPELFMGMQFCLPSGFLETSLHEQEGYDWFGVKWRAEIPAAIPDPTAERVLKDICDWREVVKFPDLDNYDWEEAARIDKVAELDRENKLFEVIEKEGPFERIQALMGMQEAMVAMMTDQDEFVALAEALTDFKCRLIDKLAQYYKPDVINFHDDYGTQRGMMLDPELWREIFKPRLKRIVERAHSHGMIFELHCCGLIEEIVPDFVEIGIDSLNCMPINDIPRLKRETNGQLCFFTGFDQQKYDLADRCGTLTEDALRAEIREFITACAEGGNYIPSCRPNEWWVNQVIFDELNKLRTTLYK